MMRTAAVSTLFMCCAVYLSNCSDREDLSCSDGDDGCRCYGNDTCNSGLICVDGTCVSAIQEADDDAAHEDSGGLDSSDVDVDSRSVIAPTSGRGGGAGTATDARSDADKTDAATDNDAEGNEPEDSGKDGTAGTPSVGSGGSDSDSGGAQNDSGSGGSGTSDFAMYIMLDSSWSMAEANPVGGNPAKWDSAVAGIIDFIEDPASAGMNIALQYFPSPNAPFPITDCSGDVYDTPEVPLGRLPDNVAAISESIEAMAPIGIGTPTEAALLGITAFCREYENDSAANPRNEPCVPVMITDGLPNGCSDDLDYLAGIVAGVYTDYGITTSVIGLQGADFAWIEEMNRQGGSDCTVLNPAEPDINSCHMGLSTTLLEALEMIRDSH
jgi:hypothetical protein